MKTDFYAYSRYLVIIAHPDDEVHCGVLLHRLIESGKEVKLLLLTNGDAGLNAAGRVTEMQESAHAIGLNTASLTFLGMPEKELPPRMHDALASTTLAARDFAPECIISLDLDGGHEGHDTASFLSHLTAQKCHAVHIAYPDYHFRNGHRYGLEFVPGRSSDFLIELTDKEKDLKIRLLYTSHSDLPPLLTCFTLIG